MPIIPTWIARNPPLHLVSGFLHMISLAGFRTRCMSSQGPRDQGLNFQLLNGLVWERVNFAMLYSSKQS